MTLTDLSIADLKAMYDLAEVERANREHDQDRTDEHKKSFVRWDDLWRILYQELLRRANELMPQPQTQKR